MTDYILVPVEPTLEMMEAGAEGCGQDLDRDGARGRAFVAYKAMLAAAPDHIADSRKMVSDQLRGGTKKIGRPQIREVFLRKGDNLIVSDTVPAYTVARFMVDGKRLYRASYQREFIGRLKTRQKALKPYAKGTTQ